MVVSILVLLILSTNLGKSKEIVEMLNKKFNVENCDKIVCHWNNSVGDFCKKRSIKSMEMKNLKQGDTYNYDLYRAYANVLFAFDNYYKTPESIVYRRALVAAVQAWYSAVQDNKMKAMLINKMPNALFVDCCLKNGRASR